MKSETTQATPALKRLRTHLFVSIVLTLLMPTVASTADPERLTTDGVMKFSPVYYPGKNAIVYCLHESPTRVALWKLNLDDRTQHRFYEPETSHQFDAAFSSDGRYHAFCRSSTSRQLVLIIKDSMLQSEVEFLPPGELRSTIRTPVFTRDDSRIIFTLSAPGGLQIASVNIEGKDLQRLTQSAGTNSWPALSPDGKQIVFSSSRNGNLDLYVMNADGSNVLQLTETKSRNIRPTWSPDGTQIAFTSARDGNYEIYIMQADGSLVQRFTDHSERDDYATWSPDGKHMLTISERDGAFDVYRWNVK
ncbi:MAG: DPP IV N-terminal domain-containing protein [Planctomycetota bacterium]|nr:DPP IV N-terminal domain-containing protein [Planctomycetota bacterium]